MIPPRVLHLGMLFTVGISYSLLFSINKMSAEAELPYVAYVFWHSLGGGLMLLVACVMMGRHAWPQLNWLHVRTYLVWGGLGIAALPDYMMRLTNDLVAVLPELEGPVYEAYFVYPEELRHSRRIAAFRDFLVARIAKDRG